MKYIRAILTERRGLQFLGYRVSFIGLAIISAFFCYHVAKVKNIFDVDNLRQTQPDEQVMENLTRVCQWLEMLRQRWNEQLLRYVVLLLDISDQLHQDFDELLMKRNPRIFDGRHITITQHSDGTYRPNFRPIHIGPGFSVDSYATEVANELMWALEGLVEERR